MNIAERSSRRSNFIAYPYREEMVEDGITDCVKAIMNYDLEAPTRGGAPNAFGYFTQCVFYAFLRRIAKEKKQDQIRDRYRDHADIDSFADFGDGDTHHDGEGMIQRVRHRNDLFYSRVDEAPEEVCAALKPKRGFPPRKPKISGETKTTKASKKKASLDQFLA
jgi:hypothetical protein